MRESARKLVVPKLPELSCCSIPVPALVSCEQEAIAAFERAAELSPGWEAPVAEADRVVAQAARTHDVVTRKGRVKARRLRGLLATLDDAGGSGGTANRCLDTGGGLLGWWTG